MNRASPARKAMAASACSISPSHPVYVDQRIKQGKLPKSINERLTFNQRPEA
jgi:hypothetical protein